MLPRGVLWISFLPFFLPSILSFFLIFSLPSFLLSIFSSFLHSFIPFFLPLTFIYLSSLLLLLLFLPSFLSSLPSISFKFHVQPLFCPPSSYIAPTHTHVASHTIDFLCLEKSYNHVPLLFLKHVCIDNLHLRSCRSRHRGCMSREGS